MFSLSLSLAQLAQVYQDTITTCLKAQTDTLQPTTPEHAELMTRAAFLVRNQAVTFTDYNTQSLTLTAAINDVSTFHVQIFLANQTVSCTCLQGVCRHRVAALLALYQYNDSVQQFLETWRMPPPTLRTPEAWRRLAYDIVVHNTQEEHHFEGYNLHYAKQRMMQEAMRHRPFEREWAPLFELFMEMHIVYMLWERLLETKSRSFHSGRPAFTKLLDNWATTCCDLMDVVGHGPRLFALDPFIDAIITCSRKFITTFTTHAVTRLTVYEHAIRVLAPHDFLAERDIFSHPSTDALMTIYAQEGELALDDIDVELALYFLGMEATQHTPYAKALIAHLLPQLKDFIASLPLFSREEHALAIYDIMLNASMDEEQEAELFLAFGTAGLRPYSHFLLRKGRYDDWVGLHILYPSSLAYATACGLQELAKLSPKHTLPIYHYYAMQEIDGKSRAHYKSAVRILRAMRTAAKRSGQQAYFNDYIDTLQHEYKRLRALQEELEKGNLR